MDTDGSAAKPLSAQNDLSFVDALGPHAVAPESVLAGTSPIASSRALLREALMSAGMSGALEVVQRQAGMQRSAGNLTCSSTVQRLAQRVDELLDSALAMWPHSGRWEPGQRQV